MIHTVTRPLITEKSLNLASKGLYTFAVPPDARKQGIARTVNGLYDVNVQAVRVLIMHGKVRASGKRRTKTKRMDWKKALVRLKDGQTIDAFEVTGEGEKK